MYRLTAMIEIDAKIVLSNSSRRDTIIVHCTLSIVHYPSHYRQENLRLEEIPVHGQVEFTVLQDRQAAGDVEP